MSNLPILPELGADGSTDGVDFSSEVGVEDVARDEVGRRIDDHQHDGYRLGNDKDIYRSIVSSHRRHDNRSSYALVERDPSLSK